MNAMSPLTGNLFVISAPSGTGKTSLVAALCEELCGIVASVSYTTRAQRDQETNGIHYRFVSEVRFKEMLRAGAFLEHARVFGNFYGTAEAAVQSELTAGTDVIVEIDWQGAAQIQSSIPNTSIFVLPPSIDILAARLRARDQDNENVIQNRMATAVREVSHYRDFDYLVVNDDFDAALENLKAIVVATRLKRTRQEAQLQAILTSLTSENVDE